MTKLKNIGAIAAAVAVIAFVMAVYVPRQSFIAGAQTGDAFTATTTSSGQAGLNLMVKTTYETSPYCELGSVIIASTSAQAITIKNATSTTDTASTTLAYFPANTAAGTYTFEAACTRGLAVQPVAGFNGFYIITYR